MVHFKHCSIKLDVSKHNQGIFAKFALYHISCMLQIVLNKMIYLCENLSSPYSTKAITYLSKSILVYINWIEIVLFMFQWKLPLSAKPNIDIMRCTIFNWCEALAWVNSTIINILYWKLTPKTQDLRIPAIFTKSYCSQLTKQKISH